jgi:hypothetical protein
MDFESLQGILEKPMITANYTVLLAFSVPRDKGNVELFWYFCEAMVTAWAQCASHFPHDTRSCCATGTLYASESYRWLIISIEVWL